MVHDLYPSLGFTEIPGESNGTQRYELQIEQYQPRATEIEIHQETYAAAGSNG
jgi:predicted enzyme involved in methoxymalonyl-ACP biosynthesis